MRVESISLLKTADPPLEAAAGRQVTSLGRLGKRLVFGLEGELYLVLHLMLAGRLHWRAPAARIPRKVGQAAFDFDDGTLLLTEAGTQRRAALHLVRGKAALAALDPGCQTDGRILADRALSRLLKGDYPRRIEDLEG